MRVIIAGSRDITDYNFIETAIQQSYLDITTIISGGARGVDKLGELYACRHNIKLQIYPANWDLYGKSAGYKRNEEMADNADALIAIWDGKSKGTKHMIDIAKDKNLIVTVYTYVFTPS